jgi:hypothetical protein
LWGFFSGFSGFPSSAKINISKFQFDHGREPQVYRLIQLSRATLVKQSRFLNLILMTKSLNYYFNDLILDFINRYSDKWSSIEQNNSDKVNRILKRKAEIYSVENLQFCWNNFQNVWLPTKKKRATKTSGLFLKDFKM